MRLNILMPIMIFMTKYYPDYILPGRLNSENNNSFKLLFLTFITTATLFITSCEEPPSTIGSDILPQSDFVNIKSTDTISVYAYTLYEDSVRSDNPSTSFLGGIYDPYFGLTTTEFVTQLRLSKRWDGLPFTIDSVKLNLQLLNVNGASGGVHYLRLSEIASQLYLDSTYYSNKQIPLTGYVVPDIRLPELKADTINYVEVNLPIEFGEYLTRDTTKLFHDNSRPDFRSFFKGLKFSLISPGDPVFLTLSLVPPVNLGGYSDYIVLFMHDEVGNPKQYYFIMDALSKNARFNLITHDFNTASPDKRIQHINEPVKDTLSYVQGLNGVFTKVIMPGLGKIKNDPSMSNIAVNKARLIVPVYTDGVLYKGSKMASQLFMRYRTTTGLKYYVPDYNPNNNFFDGKIDTTAYICKFNIASFVQAYLDDTNNLIQPEVEIFLPTGNTLNVILKANGSSTPVKFEFTYTRF